MSIAIWTFVQRLSFSKRATIIVISAAVFGASLTTYVVSMPGHTMQFFASCMKVPALLLLCPLMALYPTLFASRIFDKRAEALPLFKASFSCIVATAVCLALFAPFVAILNTLGNYTLTIFASYGAFALAGMIGCAAFYLKLRRTNAPINSPKSDIRISIIWFIIFGLISAEVGWSIRPLVGWTGQPFEWFRSDRTQIWDQFYAEIQNLRVGGLLFPSELEKPSTK
jgi:hypothetical protein